MIEAGLYKHYKGGLYRVLFVAPWWAVDEVLVPDQRMYIVAYDHAVGVRAYDRGERFLVALWSGNGAGVYLPIDTPLVIYVSLSSPGRVSARTVAEFEERVAVDGFSHADKPRFERIGP